MLGHYQRQLGSSQESVIVFPTAGKTLMWLDASDGGSFTSVSGNEVLSVDDQITGRSYVNDTTRVGGARTNLDTIGGLNVLSFVEGEILRTHFGGTAGDPLVDMSDTVSSQALTLAMVYQSDETSGTSPILSFHSSGNSTREFRVDTTYSAGANSGITPRANSNNRWNISGIQDTVAHGSPAIFTCTITLPSVGVASDSSIMWHTFEFNGVNGGRGSSYNGVLNSLPSNSADGSTKPMNDSEIVIGGVRNGSVTGNGVQGGSSALWAGKIGEVVVTNGYYDVSDLTGYLAHKWGLTSLLPVDHVHKSVDPGTPSFFV